MSEQRVDHGRTGGHVSLDQIEVFRVSLELWSAASCRTFAGRHGANVRTGQGSGRRLAATKSVRNKYPKLLGGGRRNIHQLLVLALPPTLASHAVRAQAVALLSSLPRETSACVSSGSVRRRLSLSSSLQLCTASLSLAHV